MDNYCFIYENKQLNYKFNGVFEIQVKKNARFVNLPVAFGEGEEILESQVKDASGGQLFL